MSDKSALEAVRKIAGLTEAEAQFVTTIARGEGGYGSGWATPSAQTIAESQKFGLTGFEGKDSHNWGAIQGKGPAGSFPHVDHHSDGTAYVGTFRKYNSDTEGALDVARIVLKPNVKEALARGDGGAAVYAMHENHYFELNPEKYLERARKNYSTIIQNTGAGGLLTWNSPLAEHPATLPSPPPTIGPSLPPSESPDMSSSPLFASSLPTLRVGSRGPAVKLFLGTHDLYRPEDIHTVQDIQKVCGVPADGIVGPKTWSAFTDYLNELRGL